MAKLEAELEPYADRIAELKSEIVNRDELIEHFKLNMDDVALNADSPFVTMITVLSEFLFSL